MTINCRDSGPMLVRLRLIVRIDQVKLMAVLTTIMPAWVVVGHQRTRTPILPFSSFVQRCPAVMSMYYT